MATTAADIQALYVAYFNRPADVLGLQFWIDKANAAGSTAAVANAFSNSDEYREAYADKSPAQIVDQIYLNLFGRHAEAAGLVYWANKLINNTQTIGQIAFTILSSAQNADKVAVDSKVAAATAFTASLTDASEIIGYDGDAANQVAKTWLTTVTDDTSLKAAITADALAAVSTDVVAAHDANTNVGTAYTLTVVTDTLVGTSANDTFNATTGLSADGTTAITTTNALDSIDGGAGVDTLNVENTGGINTLPVNVKNVEIVNFIGAGSVNAGGAITAATGATNINFVSTDDTAFTVNGVTTQNLGLTAAADATTLTAAYAAAGTAAALTAKGVVGDATFSISGTKLVSASLAVDGTATGKKVTVADTGATVTAVTVAASDDSAVAVTGTKVTAVTVTGAGAVDLTGTTVDLKTLTGTANTGGVTYDNTTSATNSLVAATGAGDDALTLVGAKLTSAATGLGDDTVTLVTSALAATKTVDLGAGDDTLDANFLFAAGAVLTGGDGTDTLGLAAADYTSVAAFSSANLAKITGFEVLSITDGALANATNLVLGKLAGVSSAQIEGVVTTGAATVSSVGANSSIILKGDLATGADDGSLTVTLKDATGSSDVLNLTLDQAITQNNDTTVDTFTSAVTSITANGVETVNFTSSGTLDTAVTTGNKTDVALNTLTLVDDALVTLNIGGTQKYTFTADVGSEALVTVSAVAATAAGTIDVHLASEAVTVTGSATAATTIVGSDQADTIVGGAAADTLTGGLGADKLTGGAGNDIFQYHAFGESTLAKMDVVTDFAANTYGNGTSGAAGTGANADTTTWTGDVIALTDTTFTKISVSVQSNATDAQVYIQNTAAAAADAIVAALDSTTGKLYIDWTSDGTIDSVITLTGVTTITAAAFVVTA
jgi:S-layer protein